jgi:copper chaperone
LECHAQVLFPSFLFFEKCNEADYSGCSGAVERALKRVDGIKDFQVSLKDQSVVVDPTTASFETVESAIKKTGKQIKSGEVVKVEAQPVPAPAAPAVVV